MPFGAALAALSGPMLSGGLGALTGGGGDGPATATSTGEQTSGAWSVDFAGKQTNLVWIAALLVVIWLFVGKGK